MIKGGNGLTISAGMVLNVGKARKMWFDKDKKISEEIGEPKELQREKPKGGCLGKLPAAVVALTVTFGMLFIIQVLQERLFIQAPTDIILQRKPWNIMFLFFEVEIILSAGALLERPWKKEGWKPRKVRTAILALILVNGVIFWGCLTNVSVACEDGIRRHSMVNPGGELVPYTEVEEIETGFRGPLMGITISSTGDFYYRIRYSDGTQEDWGESVSQADEETWMWMLRLDEWILSGGARKSGSEENWEYCAMDQFYVDILRQVILNRG